MPAPGRALICGATLGPITAIPQEKMAGKTAGKNDPRQHLPVCDKDRPCDKTGLPQTTTAAVARGRLWF
jgi:hypothetical protein